MGTFRSFFLVIHRHFRMITKCECAKVCVCINSPFSLQPSVEHNNNSDYLWILETSVYKVVYNNTCRSCSLLFYSPFIFRAVRLYTPQIQFVIQIFHHTHTDSSRSNLWSSLLFRSLTHFYVSRQSFTNNGSDASLEFKVTQLNAFGIQFLIKIHWIKWTTSWEIGCLE